MHYELGENKFDHLKKEEYILQSVIKLSVFYELIFSHLFINLIKSI